MPRVYSRRAVRPLAPPGVPPAPRSRVPGTRLPDPGRTVAPPPARLPQPQPRLHATRLLDTMVVRHPPPLQVDVLDPGSFPDRRERRGGPARERRHAHRDVGGPLDPAGSARRCELPDRPPVVRAGQPVLLRGAAPGNATRAPIRGPAADRLRCHLARPLRPPRRPDGRAPLGGPSAALPRAARVEGVVRGARDRRGG